MLYFHPGVYKKLIFPKPDKLLCVIVILIIDLTYNFLKDILYRYNSDCAAVFIYALLQWNFLFSEAIPTGHGLSLIPEQTGLHE